MSSFLTLPPAFINLQPFQVFLFGSLVVLYAILRPPMIRDDEERPLPPNRAVRAAIVILYLLLYVALVGLATIGGAAFASAAEGYLDLTVFNYLKVLHPPDIKSSAPGLAFALMFTSMLFEPVKQLERRALVWLHRGSHLGNDGKLLAHHLAECQFVPSDDERKRSIDDLKGYKLFFTDDNSQTIHLGSVERWRKVHTLLRLLAEWNAPGASTLSKEHRRRLPLLEQAHKRKTKLALGIVSLVSHSSDRSKALARVSEILSDAPRGDPAQPTESEAQIAVLLGSQADGPSATTRTMNVSADELQTYLRPINEYFVEEYDLLLQEVTQIASASLMQAGDRAGERLNALKVAGFAGIGLMERMNIPRLLLFMVAIAATGYVILTTTLPVPPSPTAELAKEAMRDRVPLLAALSLIMAIATLIGAYFGSEGPLARSRRIPWARYGKAGAIGILAFFLIHGVQFQLFGDPRAKWIERQAKHNEQLLKLSAARNVISDDDRAQIVEKIADRQQLPQSKRPLLRIAPWSLLPFFIVIAMCLLARVPRAWVPPLFEASPFTTRLFERTLDGLAMAGAVMLACSLSFAIAKIFGTMQPPPLPPGMIPPPPPSLLNILLPFGLLGFAIGSIVLRDVRLSAHTRLCDSEADVIDLTATPPAAAAGPVPVRA